MNESSNKDQSANWKEQLTVEAVDQLADQLIKDFGADVRFRAWYCRVIYTFGLQQVEEWRRRVSDAKNPGALFSTIASQALKATEKRARLEEAKRGLYG